MPTFHAAVGALGAVALVLPAGRAAPVTAKSRRPLPITVTQTTKVTAVR